MRIHHYMQFVAGPGAPGSKQPRTLARRIADRGHEVVTFCADFNVNDERDEPEESIDCERGGRLTIRRLPAPRGFRASLRARLDCYARFAARAARAGLRAAPPHLVLGSIQPLFTGVAASVVARRFRAPFVLEVRDLWPDMLERTTGDDGRRMLTTWQAAPLYALARALYASADRIVAITPGIRRELLEKGLPPESVDCFPNGFDPETFALEEGARERVRARYGWGDDFVAIYTGAHTESTAVDVIVRAAAELRDRDGLRFVLVGHGQTKPALIELAAELGVERRVEFHDPVPKDEIPGLLAAADVGLMTLFDSPLAHIYFQNKFMDYMGASLPILAAMEGEQADLIREHRAGRVVATFDHRGLAELVADAAADYREYEAMGRRGHALVDEHLRLDRILERYVDTIERVADGTAGDLPSWRPFM